MKVQINPPKETKIQTKYIVTIDKSLKDIYMDLTKKYIQFNECWIPE